jgi:hypothetical protein
MSVRLVYSKVGRKLNVEYATRHATVESAIADACEMLKLGSALTPVRVEDEDHRAILTPSELKWKAEELWQQQRLAVAQ